VVTLLVALLVTANVKPKSAAILKTVPAGSGARQSLR
jgi:hypothetical protein